jgi:hypothetical protein
MARSQVNIGRRFMWWAPWGVTRPWGLSVFRGGDEWCNDSVAVKLPLLGIAMGYLASEGTAWRREPALRRTYAAASWLWVLLFFGRVVVANEHVQEPARIARALEHVRNALDRIHESLEVFRVDHDSGARWSASSGL